MNGRDVMNLLVQARKDKGLRQVDIAEALNIGQPAVSELENGENSPRFDTLQRYALAVGMEVEIVLKEV